MARENGYNKALLLTDSNHESAEAKKLLSEFNVPFRELKVSDINSFTELDAPAIISREGDFAGLERIKLYVAVVTNQPISEQMVYQHKVELCG